MSDFLQNFVFRVNALYVGIHYFDFCERWFSNCKDVKTYFIVYNTVWFGVGGVRVNTLLTAIETPGFMAIVGKLS